MAHPLSGANLGTLAAIVRRGGAPTKVGEGAMIALAALARWPFSTAERLIMGPRLPTESEMPAPIFILGHWRSGTTHLYNIMSKSGAFGFVPPVATPPTRWQWGAKPAAAWLYAMLHPPLSSATRQRFWFQSAASR